MIVHPTNNCYCKPRAGVCMNLKKINVHPSQTNTLGKAHTYVFQQKVFDTSYLLAHSTNSKTQVDAKK